MLIETRHKTDPKAKPTCCVRCEVCRRLGPRVKGSGDSGAALAIATAKERGWVEHWEQIRTKVRKFATGSWCIQYFCPKHKEKAGTVPVTK